MASSSNSHAAERASESIPRCIKDRDNLEGLRYADDGVLTHTSREQVCLFVIVIVDVVGGSCVIGK